MGSEDGLIDTKLHEAVRFSQTENVKKALQQGYDPNLIGLYQWSPLHEAAFNGDKEILQMLLQKNGNPNKQDFQRSRTATHYAAENGHVECLQMLVNAGGKYNIKDADGKDCLDVVTPGGRKILERLKMRDLMPKSDDIEEDDKDEGISADSSHDQGSSAATSRRSSLLSQQDSGPVLGYIHMSVEYHAAKGSLKIRIWQLSDLLLPPPHTSMIHSIYVKSYLQPDKKRETKRKTEEVKVDSSKGHIHWKKRKEISVKHVFTPACFKFSQPLEYSGVTSDLVKDKQLEIEVCITQRYSHRSFLIGMLRMSLRSAVRKLKKERFPLIPCMNHTIPSSMKVYCASELDIVNNSPGGNYFFSNPNVRIVLPEDTDDTSDKAASNPDLQPWQQHSPSTEVDMNLQFQIMPNVPKLDLNNLPLDESGYSSEIHVSLPSELESPDSDSSKNSIARFHEKPGLISDAKELTKVKVIPTLGDIKEQTHSRSARNHDIEVDITDLDGDNLGEVVIHNVADGDRKSKNYMKKESKLDKTGGHANEESSSRPDTPTWDYYDVPTEVVSHELKEPVSPWKEGAAPVMLPMETMLGIVNSKSQTVIEPLKKDKVQRRSKKKSSPALPGKAVAVVPNIVITAAEHDINKNTTEDLELREIKIPREVSRTNTNAESSNIDAENYGTRPKSKSLLKKIDRKLFVNVDKAIKRDKEDKVNTGKTVINTKSRVESEESLLKSKPKLKKLKKMKGNSGEGSNYSDLGIHTVPCLENLTQSREPVRRGTGSGTQSITEHEKTGSSVVVDMDRLTLSASGAHVVELIEEDISITELADDDPLFTDRSEVSVSTFADIESGLEDYRLPERVSPTKYMIPMQVYEVDDTSCDESITCDNSYIPTTEL